MFKVSRIVGVCVLMASLFVSPPATQALDLGKIAQFAGGAVTSIFIHEGGHTLVAWLYGADTSLAGLAGTDAAFPDDPDHTNPKYFQAYQSISLGGYLAQNITAEFILQRKDQHDNPFALGILSMGLATNLNNVTSFYLFGKKHGLDLEAYEKWGGNPALPATLMVAYSLFSLYRIFNETNIVPYMGRNMLGINISF